MRVKENPMLRVAFVGALSSSFADRVRAHLTIPCDFIHTDERNAGDVLPEIDVLVTLVFTREMGAASTRLRLIQVPGAGLDRIDRSAMPPGASLAKVHGHETGIAEYVLGAMIALSRHFDRVHASLRAGRWDSQWAPGVPPPPVWPELAGRTLGILGYGGIGQALARRARAFDMRVCAIRRNVGQSADDELALLGGMESLPEVLERADYLAITLPLTPETQGLIGPAQLGLMKPTAILVNVSRAQIVDEDALFAALAERRIAGAALDVWYRYPQEPGPCLPSRRAFHELPNVLMTPHVSGWTDGMLEARATIIAGNIARTARGERPENMVPVATGVGGERA
jgi:phosphoglycerate dehydrogenase-like enzyme